MKSVTMATKREMSDYTVFFSVLGHKKFIHKILAKSESVRFQPLFKFFGALRELLLISEISQYFFIEKNVRSFCIAKASLIFSTKNISVFGYKVVKHLTS